MSFYLRLFIISLNLFYCFSSENVPFMSGFYTDGLDKVLDKVEIVYPERISKDGSFVSYYLPHYYNIESVDNRPRRTSGYTKDTAKETIHFFVPIEGEKHHLQLWPNLNFISPGLVIERRDARDVENINKAKISHISQRQCHYSGHIVGKPNSSAALSTCYGLAGYIRIPEVDEYMIEPVKDSKPAHDKEHPHIMYKRSGMRDRHGASNCLTKGRSKDAFEERMQWEALFGDQVRKELSGININELVMPKSGSLPSHNYKDHTSDDNLKNDLPLPEKYVSNTNLKVEDKYGSINYFPTAKQQYKNNLQETPNYDNFVANDLPRFDGSIKNGKVLLGNKLKQKPLREEMNMGNIKLPDINLESVNPISINSFTNEEGDFLYIGDKEINGNIIEHSIRKRELDNRFNDIIEANHNAISDMSDNKKDIDSKTNFKIKKKSCESKIKDFENKKIQKSTNQNLNNDPIKSGTNPKNSLETNEVGQIKRQIPKVTHKENPSKEKNKNCALNKDNEVGNQHKHNAKIINKRENDIEPKKFNLENDIGSSTKNVNQLNYQQGNVLVKKKIPQTFYEPTNGIKENNNKLTKLITDNENNIKREIHLDTSEKSWQLGENPNKSKIRDSDILLKNSQSEELTHKLSEPKTAPDATNILQNDLENNKNKDLKATKLSKVEQDHLSIDDNLMNNALESLLKDVDKSKVKKEIHEALSNIRSNDKYKHDQQIYSNIPTHQDNDQYVQFDRISLTNPQDDQKKNNNPQTPELKKLELSATDTIEENKNGIQPKSVIPQLDDKLLQDPVDEIIIRIKAPEGSISGVKEKGECEVEIPQKGRSGGEVLNSDVPKDLMPSSHQNNQFVKSPLKTISKSKDKRGALSNIGSDHTSTGKKSDQDNSLQPATEDKEFKTNNLLLEGKDNMNLKKDVTSNSKEKRDDNTIHLIIETEPELNNMENSNQNSQRRGLFCQGKNCLEIKPVFLNDTNDVPVSLNNTNVENTKARLVEKRQVWLDDCDNDTTTEKPLVCFDFYNKQFNLELMVTVDYKVVKMHEDDDIENFILTVINMVSTNFYDKSIGININIILVRLIVLTTCIKELDSDRFNPDELLENFCTWQVLINPGKDDHPHHHDLAIFVTRMEKCEGQVMGVTYMTSICRPDKACLVCVDEGLLLGNTITHQIGHSLGADHDDSESSGCADTTPSGTTYHMAPTITETSSSWSSCSRDSIIQFVKTQGSWCLTDIPVERSFNFPLMLPGQIYSAAQQCKLNFHMTTLPCSIGPFCDKLYCQVTEKLCATKGDPPADGTFCATDMWCFHKQCVHIGRRPGAVNGEWGPWTEWSICTRSCGGGISSSYRICNNPKPENGGRYCIGDRVRHRMCATNPCQGFTESFRDLQCKKTEDRPFRGRLHNWIQYHSFFLNIECALVCQNRKGDVVMRSPIVADGTPCKAGTRNVCIQGTCRNVGCDWIIDSKAKEDACGICHGNATECKIIQGVFDEPNIVKGLVEFLRIPKGSGMIFIREVTPSANTVVVSGAINRIFYLNGQGADESMPGDVMFGITHGVYEVRSGMERIFIRGPTAEELIFYVQFREPNKGVHYQYAVRETDPTYVPRYLWQFLDWDPCTDPCSGGSQRAHAKCVEDRGGVVDDQYCTDSTRPMDIIRPCNDFPCQAKWWVSVWSDCICTGSSSVMFRSVLCMRATDESGTRSEIVKESECALHKKPPTQKPCNATEEDSECVKRSVKNEDVLSSHRDVRRAVNPKTAYVALSSSSLSDSSSQEAETEHVVSNKEESEKLNENKNQKKSIKPQNNANVSLKASNKQKTKLSDKETLQANKKKILPVKYKDLDNLKPAVVSKGIGNEGSKSHWEDIPLTEIKGKQIAKLNSKNSVSLNGETNNIKHSDKSKQADDSDIDTNAQDNSKVEEKCETSTTLSTCPSQEPDTTEASTCKETCAIIPHRKTTCCKTTPNRKISMKTLETTTLRPVAVKLDELNMYNFALTVVPLNFPGKKKLPQTDPEYMNLGSIGQFGVGDSSNGTIISGQEAIDFLEFARGNASEEPVILHEDMNN